MFQVKAIRGALLAVAAVVAVLAQPVLADGHGGDHDKSAETIVDVAVGAGSFNTLVTALKAAGLVDALSGAGPFTVLAPTDDAFAQLPEGALQGLLADPEALGEVLKLHVVSGKAMASDVVGLSSVTTLQGTDLPIATDEGVVIGGARVVTTDIEASNGVIHVIDSVILP
ncbi:MAG: fasciclin domain-containing protein [Pseudomonadota bacterium]